MENLDAETFRIKQSSLEPSGGRLLISDPFLSESCFFRSVILLIEHNPSGTMGLVLNKPTKLSINEIVPEIITKKPIPVFCGGPVETGRLFYIHRLGHLIPNAIEISSGLYIDGDFDSLIAYANSGNNIEKNIIFLLGYSGWDANQLNEEITDSNWVVTQQPVDFKSCRKGEQFWKESIIQLGKPYTTWLNYPKLPYLN